MSRRDKKKDEDGALNFYQKLDKTTILQEAKYFNSALVNPKKCISILTKVLYSLNQGQILTAQEATDVFFATTKLFQSNDLMLRRLVYLCIKELSPIAHDVIIVTSSLTKDMTGKENLYRAAAIRALCSITDSTMLQAIERYMKQAIVDKNPAVSSAALVSALHISSSAPELVGHWVNEAQEAMTSESGLVSYHALGVVANIRRNDRLSTEKLMQKTMNAPRRLSPYALCLLIRNVATLVEGESESSKAYMKFIMTCLRHKSEIVIYEAAHAVVILGKTSKELAQAVSVLQIFCGSSKATLRFAGVRTLATLAARHQTAVVPCAVDLENLISDPNRAVATLAVTTLLATGTESSIDRLMKQISTFMPEISDEFKIVVVHAIRRLCSKYPLKHESLASFLAGMLRENGSVEYKSAIAEAIIGLVKENPDGKETGLAHLCEFIEDCEHGTLAIRILYVLGREGPKARQPSRYIRYIYNRVLLESCPVRAAAVSALARFGAARPELLENIMVLLARCEVDEEDEIRDRAVYYSAILRSGDAQLINDYILNVRIFDPTILQNALKEHLNTSPNEPFNTAAVPEIIEDNDFNEACVKIKEHNETTLSREEEYLIHFKSFLDCDTYGPILKSSKEITLSEPGADYRVKCIKHVFAGYLVLHFECVSISIDQLLENLHIRVEMPPGYRHLSKTSCTVLPYIAIGKIYQVFEFPANPMETLGSISSTLEFVVRDCDPKTGLPDSCEGYVDSCRLEDFDIGCADQMCMDSASSDWETTWKLRANDAEACDTFSLSQTIVGEAAEIVCEHLGVPIKSISGDSVKEIRGEGTWRSGVPVLLWARLVATKGAVTMQLTVRSPKEEIATLVVATVG